MFNCEKCAKSFTRKYSLGRHTKTHNKDNFPCDICTKVFTRGYTLKRHQQKKHTEIIEIAPAIFAPNYPPEASSTSSDKRTPAAAVAATTAASTEKLWSDDGNDAIILDMMLQNERHGLYDGGDAVEMIEIAPTIFVPDYPSEASSTSINRRMPVAASVDNLCIDDGNDPIMLDIMLQNERLGLFDDNDTDSKSVKRGNSNSITDARSKKFRFNKVNTVGFIEIKNALNRKIVWYYMKNLTNTPDYNIFLASCKQSLKDLITIRIQDAPVKYSLKLEATYNLPNVDNSAENRAFKSSARPVYADTDIEEKINLDFSKLLEEEELYTGKGSGFSLQSIDGLLLAIYEYTPMMGGSYISTPIDIMNKKAVINPRNFDQECFKWAILVKHVTGSNRDRVGRNYIQHEGLYNFSGITFPTPLAEIRYFEKNNLNVSINVYGVKEVTKNSQKISRVYPLKITEQVKEDHFNLLLLVKNENAHYAYIPSLSRLSRAQITSHHGSVVVCENCLTPFDSRPKLNKPHGQEALEEHLKICGEHKPILPDMPVAGSILKFKAWCNTQRHPIVIYADFEALLLKHHESKGANTTAFHTHHPMSYGFIVIASNVSKQLLDEFDIPTAPVIFQGSKNFDEVAKRFVEAITGVVQRVEKMFKRVLPINMSNVEKQRHLSATSCNLCKIGFSLSVKRIADHNHLLGGLRQTICNSCNLKLRIPNFVPCFFHNLSEYDAHFIVKEIGYDENRIIVIPNSEEKFISFSKYVSNSFSVRFIDSCRFMASSLAKLASNLITPDLEKFRETSKVFNRTDLDLVTRKGVYPYEYTDRWSKLSEACLPSQNEFYSTLKETHITDKEYEHAKNAWKHFDCKTLGEYSDLYLKIDVLLLADVFENFRDICMATYYLDPVFYFTAPGLSFDAMLKLTSIKLELLNDYDMLLMFEKGIRGGLTQASMRYAKANNITVSDYDNTKAKSWIIYHDCNNLYGWAMSKYMPYADFKWVEPTLRGLECLDDISEIGRIYEVDIAYPQNLHDKHNDLPFLPMNNIPLSSKFPKLMATLETKKNYVIHYRNLKQAIEFGLIVEKVHRVIQFKQSPWLAEYIDLNTGMRQKASNEFEQNFYKLMNNAVFGKTMESMRKRIEMELVSSPRRIQKLINRPTFKHCTFYDDNLVAVSLEKKIINFCKPISIGFCVLEISKSHMYDYHYNVMVKHYKDDIKLMYTDTDSLIYHIQTHDFYEDLKNNAILIDRMDTANLPRNHPCYISDRKKIPGFFSDEANGRTISEFVALRAKSYAYNIEGCEHITAKGIRGHVVKNHMTLQDHKKCLFADDSLNKYTENVSIRSFKHNLKTIKSLKLTYNCQDDKRVILAGRVHTIAHGHYRINELMEDEEI